jgi:hypothetical protein
VAKAKGLHFDQTVILLGFYARPISIRCGASAFAIRRPVRCWCLLHRASVGHHPPLPLPVAHRTVFKWRKQHLRIKIFYDTSDNAGCIQAKPACGYAESKSAAR